MGTHVEKHEYFGMYDLFQEACHGQDQHWYFEISTAESFLLIEFSNNAYDYDDIKNEKHISITSDFSTCTSSLYTSNFDHLNPHLDGADLPAPTCHVGKCTLENIQTVLSKYNDMYTNYYRNILSVQVHTV